MDLNALCCVKCYALSHAIRLVFDDPCHPSQVPFYSLRAHCQLLCLVRLSVGRVMRGPSTTLGPNMAPPIQPVRVPQDFIGGGPGAGAGEEGL